MRNGDLGELAARMCAGLDGVRACLLLSPDGLTLGAYPSGGEEEGREAWDKLESIGAPVRGFVDLGEEVWVIARRGPYTAVLVSAPTVRPGLLLDRVEALLRAAEEARVQTATVGPPQPVRRPRTSLHREPRPQVAEPQAGAPSPDDPPEVLEPTPEPTEAVTAQAPAPRYSPPESLASAARNVVDVSGLEEEAPEAQPAEEESPARAAQETPPTETPPTETPPIETGLPETPPARTSPVNGDRSEQVDRVALAREFGRLIADSQTPEEG